jgi:hypothetical protein
MWSDTLLQLERAHLLRLLVWGGTSTIMGTGVHAWLAASGRRSPLLRHFSAQTGLWGLLVIGVAASGLHRLAERDLASAARLDRLMWLMVGLDTGLLAVGATLALFGWLGDRRLTAVGGGIGIMTQAAGLLVLDVHFVLLMTRVI